MSKNLFDAISSNNLQQVQMIAGDTQTLTYYVYNYLGNPIDLEYSSCSVIIFPYGDSDVTIQEISGSIYNTGSIVNRFYVEFSGSGLSGVYQQQVKIVDRYGNINYPAQGKIIIFPSSHTTSNP